MIFALFVLFVVPIVCVFQCIGSGKAKAKGSSGSVSVRQSNVNAKNGPEKKMNDGNISPRNPASAEKNKESPDTYSERLRVDVLRLDKTQYLLPNDTTTASSREKMSGRPVGETAIERQTDKGQILLQKAIGKTYTPEEQRENCAKWAHNILETPPRLLAKEFSEKVKKFAVVGLTTDAHKANESKNRYAGVRCLDQTRVILKGRKTGDDYIHASYVTIPEEENKYICTQGPLPDTVADFWCMVIQEKAAIIIQLCNFVENSNEKCSIYWPTKHGEEKKYGNVTVKNMGEQVGLFPGTNKTILNVVAPNYCAKITHLFVTDWPDHLAPSKADNTVALYKWVKENNLDGVPVVVHCSAGVGRTSTFVGIDYAYVRIASDPEISLVDIVKEMRAQRFQAMQTHVQYVFLVICLLEFLIQEKIIARDEKVKTFMEEYQKYSKKKIEKAKVKDPVTAIE